jgi:hypothetical protein
MINFENDKVESERGGKKHSLFPLSQSKAIMSAYFNFGTMDAVTRGLASIEMFHHFLAIECGQSTMETGDDYFSEPVMVFSHRPKYARRDYPAVKFIPYKMRQPHNHAIEAMREYVLANPALRIRMPNLCDHGGLIRVKIHRSNGDGTSLTDIDIYRACATQLKLDATAIDFDELRAERKRLFDLWTAGIETPAPDTRDEYEQNRRSTAKCDHPDCDNWANVTGSCSVHRGKKRKLAGEKEEKTKQKTEKTGAKEEDM